MDSAKEKEKNTENVGKPLAIVITDKAENVADNPAAEGFYAELETYLKSKGFRVRRSLGSESKPDYNAELWVGHLDGAKKLKSAKSITYTLAIVAKNNNLLKTTEEMPTFKMSDKIRQGIDKLADKITKKSDDKLLLKELIKKLISDKAS